MGSVKAHYARDKGYKTVIDIGCNTGWQALYFKKYGINFLGIDSNPLDLHKEQIPVKQAVYPTPLSDIFPCNRENILVVSSFCIGYTSNNHREMFQQLAKDTQTAIIDIANSTVASCATEFFHIKHLVDTLYELKAKN